MMQYKANYLNDEGDRIAEDILINIKNGILYEQYPTKFIFRFYGQSTLDLQANSGLLL